MSVCRTVRFPYSYILNGIELDRVFEFNDLGIIVTSDLSWSKHISRKVAKASQMLGLIKRGIGFIAPAQVKRIFYVSLVRSVIDYGSVIWHPNKEDLRHIESVQRRATKYILNDFTSPYSFRLQRLNLLPMSFHKEIIDLCFFYKCMYNMYNFNIEPFVTLYNTADSVTRRRQQGVLLQPRDFRTERGLCFYSQRIARLWNSLPDSIRNTICTNTYIRPFRTKLYSEYANRTTLLFDINNTCTWVSQCRCSICRPT